MSRDRPFFRASVGGVLFDPRGRVLAFERLDVAGAWQLPQGGIEPGEEPLAAALREIAEETGLGESALELRGRHPTLLAYELPEGLRTPRTGRGQVQYWFYFLVRDEEEPALGAAGEFRAWEWTELVDLAKRVVDFRQPVYGALAQHFEGTLRPQLAPPGPRG